MLANPEIAQLRKETVQVLPDATKEAPVGFFAQTWRGPLLPPWGTHERDWMLRRIYRGDYMWAIQGAFSGIMKKIASTPWEITGPEDATENAKAYWRLAAKAAQLTLPGKQREDIEYWQQFLRQADFGRGWTTFCHKGVDYLRQDIGWMWEIIAPGDSKEPPTGAATGIAHLDSLKCIPTGDPEFPIIYYDRHGTLHRMHHTRIVQLMDMEDGDETLPGYGLCALSRAISIATRELLMGRYVEANLDDKPAPGIVLAQGMVKGERERAAATYREEQNRDAQPIWGKQLWFYGADPSVNNLDFKTFTFQTAPEKFDYNQYVELDMNQLALAIGIDVQELWQLTGGNIGSAGQSEILHQKSRGKTIGDLMTSMERALNDVLPEDYEFAFKRQDADEEREKADTANVWAGVVNSLGARISDNEARKLLANQIEAVQDAITDSAGKVRRLFDADVGDEFAITQVDDTAEVDASAVDTTQPKPPQLGGMPAPQLPAPAQPQAPPKPTAQTPTVNGKPVGQPEPSPFAPAPTQAPLFTDGTSPELSEVEALLDAQLITVDEAQRRLGLPVDSAYIGYRRVEGILVPPDKVGDLWQSRFGRGVAGFDAVVSGDSLAAASKEYQSTLLDFEGAFEDAVKAALEGDMPRRRFSIVSRALLRSYGRKAFIDGLKDGGVQTSDLDDSDQVTLTMWLAEQSAYLTDFANRIYKTDTEMTPDARSQVWGNKSLTSIYQQGLVSADANSLYEWVYGDTEHCATCKAANGQVHRLKEWFANDILPKSDTLECGGFNCQCSLLKVKGSPRGRLSSIPRA